MRFHAVLDTAALSDVLAALALDMVLQVRTGPLSFYGDKKKRIFSRKKFSFFFVVFAQETAGSPALLLFLVVMRCMYFFRSGTEKKVKGKLGEKPSAPSQVR